MLVLARKEKEAIVLITKQGTVTITVSSFKDHGTKVRLAIDAPKEMPVHRLEVWETILAEATKRRNMEEKTEPAIERLRHGKWSFGCFLNDTASGTYIDCVRDTHSFDIPWSSIKNAGLCNCLWCRISKIRWLEKIFKICQRIKPKRKKKDAK